MKSAARHENRSFQVQIALLGLIALFGLNTANGFEATSLGNWDLHVDAGGLQASGSSTGGFALDFPDTLGWSAGMRTFGGLNFDEIVFALRGTSVGNPGKASLGLGIRRLPTDLEDTDVPHYSWKLKKTMVGSYAVSFWNGDDRTATFVTTDLLQRFDKNKDGKLSALGGDDQFGFSNLENSGDRDLEFTVFFSRGSLGNDIPTIQWQIAMEELVLFHTNDETFVGDRISFQMICFTDLSIPICGIDVWEHAYYAAETEGAFGVDMSNVRVDEGATLNSVPLVQRGQANAQSIDSHVDVTGITDSGEDGVAVPIGDGTSNTAYLDVNSNGFVSATDALRLSFAMWDLNNDGTFDFTTEKASLFVEASGTLSDGSSARLGRLGVCNQGGATAVCFDDNRAGESTKGASSLTTASVWDDTDVVHSFPIPPGGTVGVLDFVPVGITLSCDVVLVRPHEILFSMQFPEPVPFNGGGHTDLMITALTVRGDNLDNVAQVTEVGVYGSDIEGFRVVDVVAASSPVSTPPVFLRGDATASGAVDMTDAIVTLEIVLLGQGAFPCLDAADANDDGQPDMTDAIVTLEEIFLGLARIPAPGINECGIDPTSDSIGCESYDACP